MATLAELTAQLDLITGTEWATSFGERAQARLAAAALLAVAMAGASRLGTAFLPEFHEGSLTISVNTLPGTALGRSGRGNLVRRRDLVPGGVRSISTAATVTFNYRYEKWDSYKQDEIEVRPLPADSSKALVGNAADGEIPESVAELLAERSGGNPFFLEEAFRDLVERGALVVDGGLWKVAHRSESAFVAAPEARGSDPSARPPPVRRGRRATGRGRVRFGGRPAAAPAARGSLRDGDASRAPASARPRARTGTPAGRTSCRRRATQMRVASRSSATPSRARSSCRTKRSGASSLGDRQASTRFGSSLRALRFPCWSSSANCGTRG